jgi:hypothetical protein
VLDVFSEEEATRMGLTPAAGETYLCRRSDRATGITDLRVGADGAVYVLLATSFSSAQVYRITYTP